jgi:hypothetical protein
MEEKETTPDSRYRLPVASEGHDREVGGERSGGQSRGPYPFPRAGEIPRSKKFFSPAPDLEKSNLGRESERLLIEEDDDEIIAIGTGEPGGSSSISNF